MIYMGIDPGYTGGTAFFDGKKLITMPIFVTKKRIRAKTKKGYRIKTEYEYWRIKTLLLRYKPSKIVLEKQHLTAGDGKISNTAKVGGYNLLKGMAYMYLDQARFLIDVHPMTWHKTMLGKARMKRDESKRLAEEKALQLFPTHNFKRTPRCKTNHDGMIDAALLAYYGYLMEG